MASLQSKILEFLQQNTGLSFSADSIAKEIDYEEQTNSVGSALSKMHNDRNYGVERVGRGMYRFVGAHTTKSGDMLEVIHHFESGALLLKHENEEIYLARKMEA